MARTYAQLLNFAKRALDDAAEESDITQDIIVNDAGTHLMSMHPWRVRAPVNLNLVADQAYIELPLDFAECVSIELNGLTQNFQFTTTDEIAKLRDNSLTPVGFLYWGAIVEADQLARELPPPPPRIEIHPTPTTTSVGVLQVWYRRKWMRLTESTELSNTPDYLDPLLMALIQSFASGYLDRAERGNTSRLIQDVENGPIARAAKRTSGMMQSTFGPLRGGAVQMARRPALHYLDGRPSIGIT